MLDHWKAFKDKYPMPPLGLAVLGFLGMAMLDKTREWTLAKAMLTPYLIPLVLVVVSVAWFLYLVFQPPRLDILCDASHHPFRQNFDTQDGVHHTLFRIGVKNRSKFRAVNRAEVRLTATEPFMMNCVPVRLHLMNEDRTAREFFLPPEGVQYVDVLQDSQPSKKLRVWHTAPTQAIEVARKDYSITLTAYGDNTQACSKAFRVCIEPNGASLRPKVDNT